MRRPMWFALVCGLMLLAVPAEAQLNGSHTPGDFGVQSGSQPQPGFYAALFYLRYDADTIKGRDGNIIRPSPSAPGSIAVAAAAPLAWYVSKSKILGANYGAMAVLPLANASLEAPAFALGETVDTSVSDLLVRPLDLGWHTARADVTAGFQLYAPTGRYERGGSDNIGKGMWTYEPFVGTTVYSTTSGPSVSPRQHMGAPWQQERYRRQGWSDSFTARRRRQVVPRRRTDHRCVVLRPVEAHRGSIGRVRAAWRI